jgi:hypothetical protein
MKPRKPTKPCPKCPGTMNLESTSKQMDSYIYKCQVPMCNHIEIVVEEALDSEEVEFRW